MLMGFGLVLLGAAVLISFADDAGPGGLFLIVAVTLGMLLLTRGVTESDQMQQLKNKNLEVLGKAAGTSGYTVRNSSGIIKIYIPDMVEKK
jgi:hypothetical protein